MKQPVWYRDTEKWLLEKGRWPITIGLVILILVSAFFLAAIWWREKYAIPAAAWVTYMFMP